MGSSDSKNSANNILHPGAKQGDGKVTLDKKAIKTFCIYIWDRTHFVHAEDAAKSVLNCSIILTKTLRLDSCISDKFPATAV